MAEALADIVILANGPGELATWVRPVVAELRRLMPEARLSLILVPCNHASGAEAEIARHHLGIKRVLPPTAFWHFIRTGQTPENWDWQPRGVVVFLGGDQFFTVWLSQRLGYRSLIYAEWSARWVTFVDAIAIRTESLKKGHLLGRRKMRVVGDLMADSVATAIQAVEVDDSTAADLIESPTEPSQQRTTSQVLAVRPATLPIGWQDRAPHAQYQIGLLPGSKPAKLAILLPFFLATADLLKQRYPKTRFALALAPSLTPAQLAAYAQVTENPDISKMFGTSAKLEKHGNGHYLVTPYGTTIAIWTEFPAYSLLRHCDLCLTTVGANTAELARLGVPMVVTLPFNKLEAMRAWDGLLGVLVNLPGVGTFLARLINGILQHFIGLVAWPNIWAKREIVPEVRGRLRPDDLAEVVLDLMRHPSRLSEMQQRLLPFRSEPGAAIAIANWIVELLA